MTPAALLYIIFCLIVGLMGHRSQIGFWGFFFLSLFVSPVMGFAILMIAGNRKIPGHAIREKVVEVEYKETDV